MLGHLDPEFLAVLDETCDRLRTVFRTTERADAADQRHRLGGHGGGVRQRRRAPATSSSSASTACSASACATSPRAAAPRSCGSRPSGASPIDPEALLDAHPNPKVIAVVHAETSTGVRNDVEPLGDRQGRRAAARRLRHVARRHPGRDRRVGRRHRLQRHAEVPRRAARAWRRSRVSDRARERFVERRQSWYLDLRHDRRSTSSTGGGPHVPPHRADLDDLRAARRARRGARRRARGALGPPRRVRRAAAGRAREARLPAVRRGGPPPARAHDRVGARAASTRPRCAGRCSSATASRSAAGSARSPARCGASAAWATPPGCATSRCCSARSTRLSADDDRRVRPPRHAAPARRVATSPQWQRGAPAQRATGSRSGSRRASRAARRASRTATRSPCAAAPASASASSAPATASASSSTATFAGEINLTSVQRGPFQSAYVGYWIDEAHAGNGYMPEAVVVAAPLRVRGAAACTACRSRSSPATQPAGGSSRSSGSATRASARRYLEINGAWEDHVRYAITAEEWDERRDKLVAEWT